MSMQVIVSCGIALDALYDLLKPYAKISDKNIQSWKDNGTSRGAQINEVLRRVYKIKGGTLKEFKNSITQIIKFRDMAVHPTNKLKNTCVRPDISVGVDWKFSAYKFTNASNFFESTMKMFIYLYENKCYEQSINVSIENIFKSLVELKVVTLNDKLHAE